jgi:hypothetical protein
VLFDPDALTQELMALRKGRATQRIDLPRRLGPQARMLFGVSDQDRPADVRRRVGLRVDDLLRTVPRDLRLAALAALALHPEADHRVLRDREAWLAAQLNCSEKTARRRVDDAFAALVDEVLVRAGQRTHPPAAVSDGWYVRSFRAVMRLDTPTPELLEHRVISFTRSGVAEIVCQLSLPRPAGSTRPAHDVHAEMIYGGRIRSRERTAEGSFKFFLELANPGQAGNTHEYSMLFRLPIGQPMRPHYVFQPLRPCESFDLIVRFPADSPPGAVRLVDGATQREVYDEQPGGHLLAVDRLGELRLSFHDLRQPLAYGVIWSNQ